MSTDQLLEQFYSPPIYSSFLSGMVPIVLFGILVISSFMCLFFLITQAANGLMGVPVIAICSAGLSLFSSTKNDNNMRRHELAALLDTPNFNVSINEERVTVSSAVPIIQNGGLKAIQSVQIPRDEAKALSIFLGDHAPGKYLALTQIDLNTLSAPTHSR